MNDASSFVVGKLHHIELLVSGASILVDLTNDGARISVDAHSSTIARGIAMRDS